MTNITKEYMENQSKSTYAGKNIYQRIIELQKKVTTVEKKELIKISPTDRGYKAVGHDDVARLLHLPLAECGIVMLPDVIWHEHTSFDKTDKYGNLKTWYRADIKVNVKWINADNPSDFMESNGAAFALDTSDKSFAKAYSLALKIILLKVHLLESRDEEEARRFDEDNYQEAPQRPPQKAFTPTPKQEARPVPKTAGEVLASPQFQATKEVKNYAPKAKPQDSMPDWLKETQSRMVKDDDYIPERM